MFIKKTNPLKIIILTAAATLTGSPAFAQINGLTNKPLKDIINGITVWLLGLAAALAIMFIVVGGIYYVTAGGDERQIETAKTIITYAIWGIFIIGVAYAIVVLVNSIVG
jgi:hypothetical protein